MVPGQNPIPPVHEPMLIGGEPVDGTARIEVRNPARPDEIVGTIVRGEAKHVEAAIAAAQAAQRPWEDLGIAERAALIGRALSAIETDIEARAVLYTRENGKPLAEARGELIGVPRRQLAALAYAEMLKEPRTSAAAGMSSLVLYRPFGVVVSIVPWNSPVGLAFIQIVAALLAGNCVVLKPPESCPLTLIRTAVTFATSLPKGVLNIVTGFPAEIGPALTTHPGVGRIAFTGSIPSARRIMADAAQTIKGVTLELGGNDPAILLDDADFGEKAMRAMIDATFRHTGQVCMAIKRFYVPEHRHDEFVQAFSEAADTLVVGDGLVPAVTIGPLHTRAGQERALGLVEDARRRGARVRELGRIDDRETFRAGYFMQPALVTGIGEDAPLMVEEQFCPAIPITTYRDLDDALARANNSVFGLGASVWGRDEQRAIGVARRLEAGQVWVNAHGVGAIDHQNPYGGMKQSGLGRRSGPEGILEYLQTQTITAHRT